MPAWARVGHTPRPPAAAYTAIFPDAPLPVDYPEPRALVIANIDVLPLINAIDFSEGSATRAASN